VQLEDRFAAVAHHMDMRRAVIVGVDHHAQPTDSQYRWHSTENPIITDCP